MSETENKKPPISKLAIASLLVALTGLCFYIPFSPFCSYDHSEFVNIAGPWIAFLSILSGAALGIIAYNHVRRKKGIIRGRIFSISALIIIASIVSIALLSVDMIPDLSRCGNNLSRLGKAFLLYSYNHEGKYPNAGKWCDEIAKYLDSPVKEQFICPAAIKHRDKGRCHYSMNPNCEPNSPPDTVLLFETKGGWNQCGGPELFTVEHHEGQRAFVLYNNGDVKLIKSEDIGKLKWKAEANEVNQPASR
jgi:hypothetical protein